MSKNARHVRGIVDGLLSKLERTTAKRADAVRKAWMESTTEEIKKHSRPVNFKNGTLVVIVENSSWLYKFTLEKKQIIQKFNEKYTGRKKAVDIRYRIGQIDI